jgi:hypothetical protein
MSDRHQKPVIPPVTEVRRRLAEHIEETKLLRKQLRVSVRAAAEEHRRRSQDVSRFNRQGGPAREQ